MPPRSIRPPDEGERGSALTGTRRESRPAAQGRPRPASVGAAVGLLIYLLAIYAAVPRAGVGGSGERTPGIVLARYRQVQFDAATDDGPLPRPSLLALPPVSVPAALVPGAVVASGDDRGSGLAARPASPRGPRSPPTV